VADIRFYLTGMNGLLMIPAGGRAAFPGQCFLESREVFVMAMKITDDCLACGSCIDECDINHAISEGDIYKIDPNKCTECAESGGEPKCAPVCAADAIVKA